MTTPDLTFVTGGARSGKSAHAERLAAASGRAVTYVATARVGDDEFAARVAHHRARRPAYWRLIEEPLDLAGVLARAASADGCVLVDCLTLWLANLLFPLDGDSPRADAAARIDAFVAACADLPGKTIVVSNEIGLGVVPLGAQTRAYVDELGRLNQRVAALATHATLMVSGLPVVLKA